MPDAKTVRDSWEFVLSQFEDEEEALDEFEMQILKVGFLAGFTEMWGHLHRILREVPDGQARKDRLQSLYHEAVTTLQVDIHKSGDSILDAEGD